MKDLPTPQPPDRRAEILRCALSLFTDYGYDGVGVQQIVEAAGVTKPTLYHYFGSKLGLLEALLAPLSGLDAAFATAAQYQHDITLTLSKLARLTFAFVRSDPALYRLLLQLTVAPQRSEAFAVVEGHHRQRRSLLEALFLQAAADHGNMTGRHRAYAVTFQGMLDSYAALILAGELELDDHVVYRAVHQFMHGIFS